MRAFTLAEIMVVVVIIGVMSAVAVPSIVDMVGRAEGDRAVRENAASLAAARDSARGHGVCLDYIVREERTPPPASYPRDSVPLGQGPYQVDIWTVDCPGEPDDPRLPSFLATRDVADAISAVTVRHIIDNVPCQPTDRVHFHRDGSLYNPVAQVQVDAVVNGTSRRFRVYPAAGTIEIDER